ncbi:MAG TPA: Sec-independent protein translocase subunit TatA [Streptosporangiaceae bacterium]
MGLGELSPWHLLILALVVLVLFGAKRLPDSARSLGRAMRIFKAETAGLREGDKGDKTDDTGQASTQAAPPQQLTAPPPATAQPGGVATGAQAQETPRTNQPG